MIESIDWQRPWLATVAAGREYAFQADWRAAFNLQVARMGLQNHQGLPIEFVSQTALPADMAYEWFISKHGKVPTRDNLHDFFNALVWLAFPAIKAKLNALQAGEIARMGSVQTAVRGRLRDAATLFDENAALLVINDPCWEQRLRDHAWMELFVSLRAEFLAACDTYLFGHALMEKLVTPYKAITAHALVILAPSESPYWRLDKQGKIGWLDQVVAQQIGCALSPSDFTPLPVLGLPGWWHEQDAGFYADTSVFRPPRHKKTDNC